VENPSRPLPGASLLEWGCRRSRIRKPGGSWAFHYDLHGDVDDDESGYRFGNHRFIPGEYVSIKEHDDVLRTFRVMMVQPLAREDAP